MSAGGGGGGMSAAEDGDSTSAGVFEMAPKDCVDGRNVLLPLIVWGKMYVISS